MLLGLEGWGAYGQRRVDLATFRAVPASSWGHCPQVLVFTIAWDTPGKEKVAKWSSAPASILKGLNEIYAVYGPKKPIYNTGKTPKLPNRPVFAPPQGWGLGLSERESWGSVFVRGKLFYLQLEPFCLQSSFFAYSPFRPLLDALAHCKQKSSNWKKKG